MDNTQPSHPLVSVLMSCFNVEPYVEAAVESLLQQSYQNMEYVFVNDGSSDSTLSKLQSFSDNRIKLISHENVGIVASLNKGINYCQGKYIARMDADDISYPDRIQKQVAFMEANPNILAVSGAINHFNEKGIIKNVSNPTQHLDLLFYSLRKTPLSNPTSMIRSTVFTQNKISYHTKYKYAQDVKLWADIIQVGEIANLTDTLLDYRITTDQVTTKHRAEQKLLAESARQEIYMHLKQTMWNHKGITLAHVMQYIRYMLKNDNSTNMVTKGLQAANILFKYMQLSISR